MTLRKDKQKVLGEIFDDARIKTFLEGEPPAGIDADFHLLEKAYRGMNVENFATFVEFFVNSGHRIDAAGSDGKTLAQLLAGHRLGTDYLAVLQKAC